MVRPLRVQKRQGQSEELGILYSERSGLFGNRHRLHRCTMVCGLRRSLFGHQCSRLLRGAMC